ncbi:hypothetical protein GCM10018953_74010 [Streptosporangium nondiastaticum]
MIESPSGMILVAAAPAGAETANVTAMNIAAPASAASIVRNAFLRVIVPSAVGCADRRSAVPAAGNDRPPGPL